MALRYKLFMRAVLETRAVYTETVHIAKLEESRACLPADEIMLNTRSKMKLPKLSVAVDMTFRISRLYPSPRIERRT